MTGVVVGYANINATDLDSGNDETKLSVNTFVDDAEVTLVNAGITIVSAAASAVGDNAPGVEVHMNLPGVNNALTADNYAYSFIMQETIGDDWKEGADFRIRVYGYDSAGPASTLFTTLYTKQTVEKDPIEGVTVTVDLGSPSAITYENFDIIIDRQ